MEASLPPGWSLETSRSTGLRYYYNASLGQSVWYDATLPQGWGFVRARPDAPKTYYKLTTGETSHELPLLLPQLPPQSSREGAGTSLAAPPSAPNLLPEALLPRTTDKGGLTTTAPQPSPITMGFDIYMDTYRAREPWLVRQLGHAAPAELAWWKALGAGQPVAALPLPARSHDGEGAGAVEAAHRVGVELVAAVVAVLGPAAVAGSWDARSRRYVARREAVPGYAAAHPSSSTEEGGVHARKRFREEGGSGAARGEGGSGSGSSSGSGSVSGPPQALIIKRASDFPTLTGGALFTSPAYHSSPIIAEIYTSGRTTTSSGVSIKLASAVGPRESVHLYRVVRDNNFKRCLEVGMANGMSALSMCQALEDSGAGAEGVLVSLDPFQATQWDNTAVASLARAGLSHRSRLIEEKSYLAMPELLRKVEAGEEPPFDVVFVDGMHLFDYTLVRLLVSHSFLSPLFSPLRNFSPHLSPKSNLF